LVPLDPLDEPEESDALECVLFAAGGGGGGPCPWGAAAWLADAASVCEFWAPLSGAGLEVGCCELFAFELPSLELACGADDAELRAGGACCCVVGEAGDENEFGGAAGGGSWLARCK
jgi:hypothetical protein